MKMLKNEAEDELTIQMILHAKKFSLTLDKNRCTGCGICAEICPREAIDIRPPITTEVERINSPTIDIREERCHYCGMCDSICPFGALKIRINGEHTVPVINSESFPHLVREFEVDPSKCALDCVDCEEACPLNLIEVTITTPSGKEVLDVNSVPNKENLTVAVNIEKDYCPCCRLCELKCPEGAIHVEKIFYGILRINREKCPEGCQLCLDACPIPGTLYPSDNGKIFVNEQSCVYCGACKVVCPEEGALALVRTYIRHTPVQSGAWNKALEKLASTKIMTKELRTKSAHRAKDSVKKRFPGR